MPELFGDYVLLGQGTYTSCISRYRLYRMAALVYHARMVANDRRRDAFDAQRQFPSEFVRQQRALS